MTDGDRTPSLLSVLGSQLGSGSARFGNGTSNGTTTRYVEFTKP